jgi:DNA mismatch repair ATPase MutS
MFVAAESFSTYIASATITHFKREEVSSMAMGKFDEELKRMSTIIDNIHPGSRLLFNESFSSTNVIEGSELAMQIINAMLDRGMKIVFVTYFNELAEAYIGNVHRPTFLRAERLEDGTRTFRIIQADPIPTSFGYDIFQKIFGEGGQIQAVTPSENLVDEHTS